MLALLANSSLMGLPQSSNFAAGVDNLYGFVFWFSVVSFIAITACLVYWPYRYSRKKVPEDKTPYIDGHTATEVGVSIVLFVVTMIIFGWGYYDYTKMRNGPEDALTINVTGEKWRWNFQYPNGRMVTVNSADDDVVAIPRGENVRLVMTSKDVIHSFFVPNFRVKQDVVPGLYTSLWFVPTEDGVHSVYCAEYCGTQHSGMLANFTVVEPAAYEKWQRDWELGQTLKLVETAEAMAGKRPTAAAPVAVDAAPVKSLAEQGKEIFAKKMCLTCHSVDGSPSIGPTHLGLYGTEEKLADGTSVLVDENYIRESLVEPAAKVTAGYAPAMPTYKGQLTPEEITAIIEYMKTLQAPEKE